MRFSSNAPTTPTTTTSIDVIEANLGVKRGSTTAASHDQPIQVVDLDSAQHLNGSTPISAISAQKHPHNGNNEKKSSSVDKMHEIMNANSDYNESPPLHDDDGNV